MTSPARRVWRFVLREFGATGVITAVDSNSLRLYCDAVARYEEYAALLAESGPLIRGARGRELVRNPLGLMLRQEADLAKRMADALGLTPSSRARLASPPDDDSDPFSDWEHGRRGDD